MKSINRLWILIAAVFVFVQTGSIIYDSEHSDHPHEHECEMCEVYGLQEDDVLVSQFSYALAYEGFIYSEELISDSDVIENIWPHERESRGRGPPSNSI